MARLGIDKDFLSDFAALEKSVQAKVKDVFTKFENATHTGIHLEAVQKAKDPRLKTIRIDQAWRGVVLSPETGDSYTLLKVLHHNKAYEWASRRKVSVNEANGQIEIRDSVAIDDTMPALAKVATTAPERLFDHVKDVDLVRLGIDDQTLAFARALTHEIQLIAAKSFLPQSQWDALAGLHAGLTVEEVWAEIGATPQPVDPEDVDGAIERSSERIVLVDGPVELLAVLNGSFAQWRVYLHPTQQRMATAGFAGPARVTGGPGTGKTVVALHRARALAERLPSPDEKVVVTTFTGTLTKSLETGLDQLVDDPEVRSRIEVSTLDALARRVYVEYHGHAPQIVAPSDRKATAREAIRERDLDCSETFLLEEWEQVVVPHGVTTAEEYMTADRRGRGKQLSAGARRRLWPALNDLSQALSSRNLWSWPTLGVEAARILDEKPSERPFRHAVVDEAQDLSLVQWRLFRALVASGPNDLFIAGDTHQRIYTNRISLRDIGIPVTGRSAKLTVNYRTTAEILAWSLGMLQGEPIDDMDDGLESVAGYRSSLHGRPPKLTGHATRNAEMAGLVETVKGWIDLGVAPGEIGVAARTGTIVSAAVEALEKAGLPVRSLKTQDPSDAEISVASMHRMKGLEFRCVATVGLNSQSIPIAVTPAEEDPVRYEQDLLRERCLLFVAATRAREQLSVSWYGAVTPFLYNVDGAG